jgi:hypothetical protein
MAQIIEQKITIVVSKLVRTGHDDTNVLTDQQLVNLFETLPTVIEQVLDDNTVLVELQPH